MKLLNFIKGECSNFDKRYCFGSEPCKVLTGERCGFFERNVLCPPDYRHRQPTYDYQKLAAQYAESTKTKPVIVKQRMCSCKKNPLRQRQRFCDDCAKKRRKDSNRKYNQKRDG